MFFKDNYNTIEIHKLMTSLTDDEKNNIINSGELNDVNEKILKIFFLRSNYNIKKKILTNKILFNKIMNFSPNENGKLFLELLDDEIIEIIINTSYIKDYQEIIIKYLQKINLSNFYKIINKPDFFNIFDSNSIFKNSKNLYNYLINQLHYDINISELFINRIKNNLNPLILLRIKNEKELLILAKFNLLIEINDNNTDTINLKNGFSFKYGDIKKLYTKHVYTISNMLQKKNNSCSREDIFAATLILYTTFGFDNSFKIINDTFSNMTTNAILRIGEATFKDQRREYRIKNQNKFYYYGIEENTIKALKNNDTNFFKQFTYNDCEIDAIYLIEKIKKEIKNIEPNFKKECIKKILIDVITQREAKYRIETIANTKNRINKINLNIKIDANIIINIFDKINITFNLDENGIPIINSNLQKFLLGNLKKDNDCLLRLILNKEAFGLNDTISNVINNFDMIQEIINKSNGKLSLNSILDIIDISKVTLYDMKPDLQDIMLSTLSKIIKSKKYCTENEDEIIKNVFILHRERKFKVFSTIPSVKSQYKTIKYYTVPFDADYLLASGIDADNCFKVGALGEEFLRYCLLNKNGVIVYLCDNQNNVYVCPFIRSGNTIHCNGIDPKPDDSILDECLEALKQSAKEVCDKSYIAEREHYDNIEAVTITDLHIGNYMKNSKYEKFDLQEYLPIDAGVYTDYNKKDKIQHYYLYKSDSYNGTIYYVSDDQFYQHRNPIYKYNVLKEYDKERINIIVNNIAYSYINFLPIDDNSKKIMQDNYQEIDASKFRYIVGNKDWFIAIDDRLSITSFLLPYDKRAKVEYLNALEQVKEYIKHFTNEDINILKRIKTI